MEENGNSPQISVILPVFNGESCIEKAIKSVLEQSFQDFELIIINDASTDNTFNVIKKCAETDLRIKIYSNESNLKLPATLNKGFSLAKGKYLTWISDDNFFKQDALLYMYNYLEAHKDVDLISCAMDKVKEDGTLIRKTDNIPSRKSASYLAGFCNVGACFLMKKEVFQNTGPYNTNLICGEDYEYWCRIALKHKIEYSSKNYFTYVVSDSTMSVQLNDYLKNITSKINIEYSDKILEKYPASRTDKAYIYYQIFKNNPQNTNALKKAFLANPFLTGIKYLLYSLKQKRKKKK